MSQIPQIADSGLDPTSLQAWRERRTELVDLGGGVAVRIKKYDLLALLSAKNGVPNPLMALVAEHTGDSEQAIGQAVIKDPAKLDSLRTMLDEVALKVIVAPPLIENGNTEGISVNELSLDEKLTIFNALAGGERLTAVQTFLGQSSPSLVLAPDRPPVQPDSQPPAGN
jgi:hypothetical protein